METQETFVRYGIFSEFSNHKLMMLKGKPSDWLFIDFEKVSRCNDLCLYKSKETAENVIDHYLNHMDPPCFVRMVEVTLRT